MDKRPNGNVVVFQLGARPQCLVPNLGQVKKWLEMGTSFLSFLSKFCKPILLSTITWPDH